MGLDAKDIVPQPNGPIVWAVIGFSTLAWIFSITASAQCAFVRRSVEYVVPGGVVNQNPLFHEDIGIGYWGWFHDGQCFSYTIGGNTPNFDGAFGASRAFTGLADFFGGCAVVVAWFSVCFPFKKFHFRILAVALIVVAFVELISLIILASSVCTSGMFFSYALPEGTTVSGLNEDSLTSSCNMGPGSSLVATSGTFYLLAGVAARFIQPPKDNKRDANDGGMDALEPLDDDPTLDDTLDDIRFASPARGESKESLDSFANSAGGDFANRAGGQEDESEGSYSEDDDGGGGNGKPSAAAQKWEKKFADSGSEEESDKEESDNGWE